MSAADLIAATTDLLALPGVRPVAVFLVFVAGAFALHALAEQVTRRWASEEHASVVPLVLGRLRRPLLVVILLAGFHLASLSATLPDTARPTLRSVLMTVIVLISALAIGRLGPEVLRAVGDHPERATWLQPRAVSLFDMAWKLVIGMLAINLTFVAWHIDVTAWLASAGVIGVAVGFAAQDTMSNLFSGVFILADAPFRVGDVIVLEDGTRGRVLEIGLRSTRLVTVDAAEVIVPNAQLANKRISNITAGPSPYERILLDVGVGYDSDLDAVRATLETVLHDLPHTASAPGAEPAVRFRNLADSAVIVRVVAWCLPEHKEIVLDALVTGTHKRLRGAGIEIPFPQLDVTVRPT